MKDQDDVIDSEQRVVVCTESDNHLSGEGQVVGAIVEYNDDTAQRNNHIGAVVTKQTCLNHFLVTTLFSFMH